MKFAGRPILLTVLGAFVLIAVNAEFLNNLIFLIFMKSLNIKKYTAFCMVNKRE